MKKSKATTKKNTLEVIGQVPTIQSRTIVGNTTACSPVILETKKIILLAYGAIIKSICIETGNLLTTYSGHQDIVTNIVHFQPSTSSSSFSSSSSSTLFNNLSNDTFIASTAIDGSVHIWNLTTLETIVSSNVGSPILKLLFLPRIKENRELLEEKDTIAIKSSPLLKDAYFITHPDKNVKDITKQTFQVQVHTVENHFQHLTEIPLITTTSTLIESFTFSSKPQLVLDVSSSAVETALITIDNKHIVFHILSKHLYGMKTRKFEIGLEIVALASHSQNGLLAVGTQYGEIFLYRNVHDYLRAWYQSPNKKDKELDTILVKSKLIWHSHAVKSLSFGIDGRILYSGGEESVLTIWNLNKSLKTFIPRIGAPICSIVSFQDASQATKVLISSADNGLKLVNTSSTEVEWSWQALFVAQTFHKHSHNHSGEELKQRNRQLLLDHYLYPYAHFDQQSEKNWKPVLEVDPISHQIVVAGNLGYLQLLDVNTAVVSKKITIVNFLRVSRKDSPKHLFVPTITHFKFSRDGRILVTVDVKKNEEIYTEYSLKFWLLEESVDGDVTSSSSAVLPSHGNHELIAQMNSPHHDVPISALAVGSLGHVENQSLIATAATGGSDGTVKVWKGHYETVKTMSKSKDTNHTNKQNAFTDVKSRRFCWNCAYSFQYRNSPVQAITLPFDLSALVVTHDNLVSFWNPETVSNKHQITDDFPIKIRYLSIIEPRSLPEFGGGCDQMFLVIGSVSVIRVYNLITMELIWSYTGRFINNFVVAKDEHEIWKSLPVESNQEPDTIIPSIFAKEGWIAITSSSSKLHYDESEEIPALRKKRTSEDKSEEAFDTILIFSPVSATPLVIYPVQNKKIVSLAFLRNLLTKSTELIALTADSELISIAEPSSAAIVGKERNLQVAQIKQARLPVLIHPTVRVSEGEENGVITTTNLLLGTEEKKEQIHNQLLVPNTKRFNNKNWMKELIPESTQNLPKSSDITLDFLKAISSQRDPNSYLLPTNSSLVSSSTLTNSNSSSQIGMISEKRNAEFASTNKKPSNRRKIDLDQITSILEKKIPLLAKRPYSSLNFDVNEENGTEEEIVSNGVHVEGNGKLPDTNPISKTPKKENRTKEIVGSPTPKAAPSVPLPVPTPDTENRRKTRRMTRSESDLSDASFPTSLSTYVTAASGPPSTAVESTTSQKDSSEVETLSSVSPQKHVPSFSTSSAKKVPVKATTESSDGEYFDPEPRTTRSQQRKKVGSESESESEVDKKTRSSSISEPRSTRSRKKQEPSLASIPENTILPAVELTETKKKEEKEESIEEVKSIKTRSSSRKRTTSDTEEMKDTLPSNHEEMTSADETKPKRRNTKK